MLNIYLGFYLKLNQKKILENYLYIYFYDKIDLLFIYFLKCNNFDFIIFYLFIL